MTANWLVPLLSPITPRPLMPSSAWSPRLKKMPPSLCTHHTPLCYRSVTQTIKPSLSVRIAQVLIHSGCEMSLLTGLWVLYFLLTGCESHSDSLHPQCHPLHWWNPGAFPTLCSAGLSPAERQPSGNHCLVRSRIIVTVQDHFNLRKI